jgi:hypothetical protein
MEQMVGSCVFELQEPSILEQVVLFLWMAWGIAVVRQEGSIIVMHSKERAMLGWVQGKEMEVALHTIKQQVNGHPILVVEAHTLQEGAGTMEEEQQEQLLGMGVLRQHLKRGKYTEYPTCP